MTRTSTRPNVLLIQADQFRWDCIGAAGNPDLRTPALDRLAGDGVLHTEAFCPFPVCTPSRYSMLSGLYVHQHMAWTNHSTLAPPIDTFPKALRRAGYRTAAVGKMHFTPTYLDVGYDHMTLAEQHGPGRYDDDYHRELRAEGLAPVVDLLDQEEHLRGAAPDGYWASYGTGPSDLPEEWHSTTWIGDRALDELKGWTGDGGQLLHVSFVKPHHPFDPPAPWDQMYDPDDLTLLPGWTERIPDADLRHQSAYFDYGALTEPVLRRVMAHYYGSITQLDHQIGRMLSHLHQAGLYDDTLVIFTSDHGEYLGFHHLLLKWGPMYDPVVKVPLIVKFPSARDAHEQHGRVPGTSSDALVSLVDVAPTVLAACGVAPALALPGLDLADPASERHCVFAESCGQGSGQGMSYLARSRTHKLLVSSDTESDTGDALFDLTVDPFELRNRLGDATYAHLADDLRTQLARWVLFDTPAPTYLDTEARQISAPNVPTGDEPVRRREHRAYFDAAIRRHFW
jgi:arylsulfatase A-like enzyme